MSTQIIGHGRVRTATATTYVIVMLPTMNLAIATFTGQVVVFSYFYGCRRLTFDSTHNSIDDLCVRTCDHIYNRYECVIVYALAQGRTVRRSNAYFTLCTSVVAPDRPSSSGSYLCAGHLARQPARGKIRRGACVGLAFPFLRQRSRR